MGSIVAEGASAPGLLLERLSRARTRLPAKLATALGPRIRRRLSN